MHMPAPEEIPESVRLALAHTFAHLFANPIAGLLIGISIGLAYDSRTTPLKYAWGRNSILVLTVFILIFHIQRNFLLIAIEKAGLPRLLRQPTIAQIIIPAMTGCIEAVVQFHFIERIRSVVKGLFWSLVPRIMSVLCFIVSCVCTVIVAFKDKRKGQLEAPKRFGLPTGFVGGIPLFIWVFSALLTQLSILGAQFFSSNYRQKFIFNWKNHGPHNNIKQLIIVALKTPILHTLLLLTIAIILCPYIFVKSPPDPRVFCAFLVLNLLRSHLSYFTLIFSMVREKSEIVEQYPLTISDANQADMQKRKNKNETAGNVMVHTVRSQVVEV